MAEANHPLRPYFDQLNDYHGKLISCAELSAHLLDHAIDISNDEWHRSGCFLMRDMLTEMAKALPFPSLDLQNIEVQVQP